MGKKDLQAFIAGKKRTEQSNAIDWTKKKDEWLVKLNELYLHIDSWLKEFEEDAVSIQYLDKEMNEEHIGIYTTKKMILRIANEQVVLDPVGTRIIGAAGRVDMRGKNGKVKFILVPESSKGGQIKVAIKSEHESEKGNGEDRQGSMTQEWIWKIATAPPAMKYIDIDPDSFSDAWTK